MTQEPRPAPAPTVPVPTAPFGYILLVAMLISIGALATDIMLPALDVMGHALGRGQDLPVHYIISSFFLGMAVGQLLAGPLSDTFGRKPVVYGGYALFGLGCLLAMVTESWAVMLAARVLQGLGAAAPRVVTVALVRDEYEGRAMARIMSIIMAAFIIVPILAPAVGAGLIALGGWRAIFGAMTLMAVGVSVWFGLRLPETLPRAARRPFQAVALWRGLVEILRSRVAMGYTLASGLINGVFLAYLGAAQVVFEGVFEVGALFPAYFALAAAAIGAASLVNAGLVMRLGMQRLTVLALAVLTLAGFGFWALMPVFGGVPPLGLFILWQLVTFFCVGITFGNLNALALEPLGHIAGLGAAFVGSLATFLSLPLASVIAERIEATVTPLVAGFALLGLATWGLVLWTGRGRGA